MAAKTDPFVWDVSQVINALTRPGSPWEKQPESITENLRLEEFDGETLLTFDQTCSREELYSSVGLRTARQKAWFEKELVRLRAESPKYRQWTHQFRAQKAVVEGFPEAALDNTIQTLTSVSPRSKQQASSSNSEPPPSKTCSSPLPAPGPGWSTPQTNNVESQVVDAIIAENFGLQSMDGVVAEDPEVQLANGGVATPEVQMEDVAAAEVHQPQAESSTVTQEAQLLANGVGSERAQLQHVQSPSSAQTTEFREPSEPRRKKKKLAPTNIAQAPLHKVPSDLQPWENNPAYAYLGDGALSAYMIKSHFVRVSTKFVDTSRKGQENFQVFRNNHLPPGRRLAVNRTMKQMMRKNGRKLEDLREGVLSTRDSTPSDEEDDDILDLENLPDFDEATLKEIEDEEKSREEVKRTQRQMPPHEVQATLDNAIEQMTKAWSEDKLPRYQRKAYKHWLDARKRHNSLRERIERHQERAAYYDQRIKKLSTEIRTEIWFKKKDIVSQAQCLEQSLDDKLHNLWLAKVLVSNDAPPPPHVYPRPAPRPDMEDQDPMEDILVSTDEESDFIVSDGEEVGGALGQDEDVTGSGNPATPIKKEKSSLANRMKPETEETLNGILCIDLTSPSKPHSPPPSEGLPLAPSRDVIEMDKIGSYPKNHWARKDDRFRLAIHMLLGLPYAQRTAALDLIRDESHDDVWNQAIMPFSTNTMTLEEVEASPLDLRNSELSRVFLSFIKCRNVAKKRMFPLREKDKEKISQSRDYFDPFCTFLRNIADLFPDESQIYRRDEIDQQMEVEEEETESLRNGDSASHEPSRARKPGAKEVVRNKAGVDLRERQNEMLQMQEERRAKLRSNLKTSGIMPHDKSRLIINEAKDESQSFIYINNDISRRIKDHQIDGVRFLWNLIIRDPAVRQGCLLAHTMGLGKTMQVITFLVAMAEAVASPDEKIRSQIPADLRSSLTLILCPSGLVINWMDELLTWAPPGVLGPLVKIDSTVEERDRQPTIENWAANGGVLVIGYDLFKRIYEMTPEMKDILSSKPNVVVADEAHKLKNQDTMLSRACADFSTSSRIALTGSPLANNVEEYYSMINWVAPNFLGPLDEFREIYGNDIINGLYSDSTSFEKKRALKVLEVLKDTVAPIVNRATIKTCLADDLPPKTEYVISVAPTALQRKLYDRYLQLQQASMAGAPMSQLFSTVSDLGLICNHPRCFREKVAGVKKGDETTDGESNKSFPREIIPFTLKETAGADPNDPSLSMKVELLNIILDQARAVGDKVLVFSHSIVTLNYLQNLYQLAKRRISRLDGGTNPKVRQGDTKAFNEGDKEVYLISTTAGGVGLNIQGANRVVLFDTKWNPVDNQQAVGRAYRLGQQKPVFVYYFLVAGSFEDNMQDRNVFKQQLAQRVVDKKNPLNWSARKASLIHLMKKTGWKSLAEFQGRDAILDCLINHRVASMPDVRPVCNIVSADTFEEEDTNVVLSEQDRQEAKSIVSMNRLRQTNRAEYDRLISEQQARPSNELYTGQPYSTQPWSGQPIAQSQGGSHRVSSTQPQGSARQHASTQPQVSSTEPQGDIGGAHHSAQQPLVHKSQAGQNPGPPPIPVAPSHNIARQSKNGSHRQTAVPIPAANTPPVHKSQTGQNPGPPFVPSAPRHNIAQQSTNDPHRQTAVPLPILGANTYLGKSQASSAPDVPSSQNSQNQVLKRATGPSKASQGGIFTHPKTPDKEAFRTGLIEATKRLHASGKLPAAGPKSSVESICKSIETLRTKQGDGFLYDNQHWKQLKILLANDRFVLATLSGQLTPHFVALANKSELERRVDTLTRLSDAEFGALMGRSKETPDPQNLENISRGFSQKNPEGVAKKDIKIMREAADNRRKSIRLPSWASDALSGNTERPSQQ